MYILFPSTTNTLGSRIYKLGFDIKIIFLFPRFLFYRKIWNKYLSVFSSIYLSCSKRHISHQKWKIYLLFNFDLFVEEEKNVSPFSGWFFFIFWKAIPSNSHFNTKLLDERINNIKAINFRKKGKSTGWDFMYITLKAILFIKCFHNNVLENILFSILMNENWPQKVKSNIYDMKI